MVTILKQKFKASKQNYHFLKSAYLQEAQNRLQRQKPAHINQLVEKACGQYQLQVHLPTMVQVQNVYHAHTVQKPMSQAGV